MVTANFSEIKKQEIRISKFGWWGRNKGFGQNIYQCVL